MGSTEHPLADANNSFPLNFLLFELLLNFF
jgi:hypothetical protein